MVAARVMVIVMKTGTIDDGDGDDNMIPNGLVGLLTRSIIFYIFVTFTPIPSHLSFRLLFILHYFWGIQTLGQPIKILYNYWFPEE